MTLANDYEYSSQMQCIRTRTLPYVEVVEEPLSTSLRFRYECERRSAGCIIGVNSTPLMKTYPTIKIHGYQGAAAVIISCVTLDDPPKPHPHSIVGRESCRNGICSMKVHVKDGLVSFSNLGIQCVKKKQVKEALKLRKHEQVDPFKTGFSHMEKIDTIDFNAVRLCFQVFILGPEKKFNVPLKPVVTGPIYDKKSMDELVICKISHYSAPASGGMEMVLLCGKITKDDIQVRFFEMRDDWLFWEGYGDFQPMDVHKQVAIVFKTPRYCNQDINEPVTVFIQLRKKSDGSTSKPVPFQMLPLDIDDMNSLKRKRMKFDNDPRSLLLQQMQAQAEKQHALLNQALLYNFRTPKFEEITVQRPSPIFQDPASSQNFNFNNNNQIPVKRMGFNIPRNEEYPWEGQSCAQSLSVPEPRTLLQAEQLQPRFQDSQFCFPIHQQRTQFPQPRHQQSQPRSEPPQSQPRRRTEPPPPNVTVNSCAYREEMSTRNRQQESIRQACYFLNQQSELEGNREDPFGLNDLSSNFDQLEPQDLAVLETTNSESIVDNLSENLSKGLSISDQIQDTIQNIQELNRDVEASQQQQNRILFMRTSEKSETCALEPSFLNVSSTQIYENRMGHQETTSFFS